MLVLVDYNERLLQDLEYIERILNSICGIYLYLVYGKYWRMSMAFNITSQDFVNKFLFYRFFDE